MLARPDAQSFTKFLASLGLFLCVAALSVPVLAFRDTSVLRISEHELGTLTEDAQHEIERRQRVTRTISGVLWPWGSLGVLVVGAGLLGVALPRLSQQEATDNQRAAAELTKLKGDLEPQTAEEVAASARQEAVSEAEAHVRQEALDEAEGSEPAPPDRSPSATATGSSFTDRVANYQRIEKRVLEQIAGVVPPTFGFHPHVKVDGETPLRLDAVLRSRRTSDVLVVVKILSHLGNVRNRVDEAAAEGNRFRNRVDPAGRVWLILVMSEEVSPAQARLRVNRAVQDLGGLITVSVTQEEEIETLKFPPELAL